MANISDEDRTKVQEAIRVLEDFGRRYGYPGRWSVYLETTQGDGSINWVPLDMAHLRVVLKRSECETIVSPEEPKDAKPD